MIEFCVPDRGKGLSNRGTGICRKYVGLYSFMKTPKDLLGQIARVGFRDGRS